MYFERGKNPKSALGIGIEALVEKLDGVIIFEHYSHLHDTEKLKYKDKPLIISITNDEFYFPVNTINYENIEGKVSNLYKELKRLVEEMENRMPFSFPISKHIHAQTIGQQLVSVQPLNMPKGLLMNLDYQYKIK